MQIEVLKFKGNASFVTEWSGFERTKAINLVIGRNNSGKSKLLDLVQIMCTGVRRIIPYELLCSAHPTESDLRSVFSLNSGGGDLPGNHWLDHGALLVGKKILWQLSKSPEPTKILCLNDHNEEAPISPERARYLSRLLSSATTVYEGKEFVRLLADRDIQSEPASKELTLGAGGKGATNIIKRHILSSNPDLPRERIQNDLRCALNNIFADDGNFSEIQTQEHEDTGHWEIYLGEERKGLIALSKSGSGLKTVILVLLNLLIVPKIKGKSPSEFVFAFEELENNLHPALLRRLLRYIENFAINNKANIYLTTHSNVALDLFGTSEHAQIVHVSHDGSTARTSTIDTHFRKIGVVSELGAKPSDILQSNGIIWVEGPSDVIYLNKWIELASDGKYKEGRDYLCAFYGGALIARAQFADPQTADSALVNLLSANSNFVIICDSDKTSESSSLKARVQRINDEVTRIPNGMIWITHGKEIENYLPGIVIKNALNKDDDIEDPKAYESFFPAQKADSSSYAERALGITHIDKIDLAIRCRPHFSKELMEQRFDWMERMNAIVDKIGDWNS